MRVLHVIPSVAPDHGGPSCAIAFMEKALCAAGIEITTATTDDGRSGNSLETHDFPYEAQGARRVYFRKWIDFYKIAPSLLPWLQRHLRDFDVVHIHALFSFSSVAAALMAARNDVPYVVRPLGALTQYGVTQRRSFAKRVSLAVFERRILRQAAAVHFTSELELEEAVALESSLNGVVIPLGVDPVFVEPSPDFLREHPSLCDRTVLLYLSRLDPKKNLEGLLRAFAMLKPADRKLMLLVAGNGECNYAANLKSLAASLEIAEEVVWLGHVDGATKAAALAAADIFVLPSFSENFGIAGVEAMQAGLPCVLGRGVATARKAEEAGACLRVESDPQSIAAACANLLADEFRRTAMGKRAAEFARKEYALATMTEKLIALYESIGSRNGRKLHEP